jgi:hypothetical protein
LVYYGIIITGFLPLAGESPSLVVGSLSRFRLGALFLDRYPVLYPAPNGIDVTRIMRPKEQGKSSLLALQYIIRSILVKGVTDDALFQVIPPTALFRPAIVAGGAIDVNPLHLSPRRYSITSLTW